VRRETGKEWSVKVRYDEGLAIRIGPEPCVVGREVCGEASVGDGTGQPLSRDRNIPGADAVEIAKGNMVERAKRVLGRPGVVRDPGMCRRSLHGNREVSRLAGGKAASVRIGKARSRSR
jgi:hypothetical protein